MSHATKRKRSMNAVLVLSAAGLSLSLASGASAAIGKPAADVLTSKSEMSHEITLCEEEISDVAWRRFIFLTMRELEHRDAASTSRRAAAAANAQATKRRHVPK
jgi:hypothetical protein